MQHVTANVPGTGRWTFILAFAGLALSHGAAAQSRSDLSHIAASVRVQEVVSRLAETSAVEEVVVLTSRQTQTWTGEEWSLDNQSLLAYDGVRRVEEAQYQWFDNGEFGISNRTSYAWSDLGFLTELREQWNSDTQAFEPVDRYTYFFAADGKTISTAFYEVWIGTEFRYAERTLYALDENLLLTGGEVGQWNGTAWDPMERFTLSHDGANVTQIDERWNGIGWENDMRTVFQNVSLPELFERVEQFSTAFEDFAGLNYGLRFLPPMGIMEWNGATWVNSERTIHDMYDVFTDQVMRVLSLEWNEDRWVPTIAHHFEYDTASRQPRQIDVKAFDGETTWTTFLAEQYEIDNLGDISAVTVQYDFGGGLENVSRIDFVWSHIAVGTDDAEIPADYRLEAAYPNPFNPSTTIAFEVGVTGPVALRIYDTLGRQVATLAEGIRRAGRHEVAFSAGDLTSGQYVVRLEAPRFNQTRLITLLK